MSNSIFSPAGTQGQTGSPAHVCGLRLTLTSGTPLTTSDVTGAGTIYLSPSDSGLIRLYTASQWTLYTTAEISLVLTITSGKNYDVFAYWTGTAVALELSAAWASDTSRTDAVARQDGILVKSADHTRLLVGTIRASGTNITEDSYLKRFVWNRYNQASRPMKVTESTASWTYSTSSWRQANGSAANQLAYVSGDVDTYVSAHVQGLSSSTGATVGLANGIGIDSTTVNSGVFFGADESSATANQTTSQYRGYPGLGYHIITWLEYGASGGKFYGAPAAQYQTGMLADISGGFGGGGGGGVTQMVTVQAPNTTDGFGLTLLSATFPTTTDVTGAGVLYSTPVNGNTIGIYDGTAWQIRTGAEHSLSLIITSGKNYDVFEYWTGSTLALTLSNAWTNDTTRADALASQDGILVLASDHTKRFKGTIRASGTNTTEDSVSKRFVWNANNRPPRTLKRTESTASWTYATAAWRQANSSASNQVAYVSGDSITPVKMSISCVLGQASSGNVYGSVGIGIDSTTVNSADITTEADTPTNFMNVGSSASYNGFPGLGYHYISWLEWGSAAGTGIKFYSNSTPSLSGMVGEISGSLSSGGSGGVAQVISPGQTFGLYSSRPATNSVAAGAIYAVTNGGPAIWISDGSAWHPICGNDIYGTQPPLSSSLTWLNQGSCTVADTNGQVVGTAPSETGAHIRGMYATSTGNSATAAARIQHTSSTTSGSLYYPAYGVFLRESSSGKICSVGYYHQSVGSGSNNVPILNVSRWTDPNTRVASFDAFGLAQAAGMLIFRVRVNGSNITFEYSVDNITWREATGSPIAKTTCFTTAPDQSGIFFGAPFSTDAGITMDAVFQHVILA